MRRPTPLPADRTTPARPAEPPGREEERPPAADRAAMAEPEAPGTGDDQPTAPIIPLAAAPSVAAEPVGGSDADSPPERVGLREVWSAARARRRALRAEVRRFTARRRRRRAVWIGVAASLVLLVLGTLGAAYSPLFAVEEIRVIGAQQLDPAEVAASLASQQGVPLPLVDESAVKAALVGFPLVESYTLEARPPHTLVVRLVERTPIGYLQTRAGFTLVDAAGVALATAATPGADAPLLTVPTGVDSAAFTAIGHVMRSLPAEIAAQVTAVAANSPDDVTLTLGGTNTEVVWGSAERSAMKAVVLASAMTARPPDGVSAYDVSSPEAVVIR